MNDCAPLTNHVAEVAVPAQSQITVRFDHGTLEIGQEYDGEWHAIYAQPDNVLRLVRSMLCMIGHEDAYLYTQKADGCHDLDWPEGPLSQREVAMMAARPDVNWHAVLRDFCDSEAAEAETDAKPKPKDATAAERMRRYRARKRNGDRNGVTDSAKLRLGAAE